MACICLSLNELISRKVIPSARQRYIDSDAGI